VIVVMPNMSNQFYNYLANHIFNFFEKTKIKNGDRFYLQLDSKHELDSLINAIKEVRDTIPFDYQHDLGDQYSTICVLINNVKIVIANTEENVKPDFLVTLRNEVGEQKGVWKNTALLSIVTEQLDSIQGGSSDLQKEGMPLHPNFLYKILKEDIENRVANKIEQVILLDNLTSLMSEQIFQQISFFDFENIFSVITKGQLEEQDYINFGLFKDLN
jgi:DNA phosphorothioation-dependent restriction protein DptH